MTVACDHSAFRRIVQAVAFIPALFMLMVPGCAPKEKSQPVDYSARVPVKTAAPERRDTIPPLHVVITSIYSAQESYAHFQELFSTIGKKCGVSIIVTYCRNYREALDKFKSDSVDIGVACPSLYVLGRRGRFMRLLAVPVISGRQTYQAYLIVPANSRLKHFNDLENRIFSLTDELSLVGYFYPLHRSPRGTSFWRKTVLAGSHDNAIGLVNQGIVDGASVSSHVFDYLKLHSPEKTANVRIIEKSEEFGLPPIVIGNRVSPAQASSLQSAFLSLSSDSAGTALLHSIGIDRFTIMPESLYASAEKMVPENAVR
jgi:phosphonate transport system substrate-binding protein